MIFINKHQMHFHLIVNYLLHNYFVNHPRIFNKVQYNHLFLNPSDIVGHFDLLRTDQVI